MENENSGGEVDPKEQADPAGKLAKAPRVKPTQVLPTDRVAFDKQSEILRAYGQLGASGKSVTNAEVAAVVKLHPNTAGLANSFFIDCGLLTRGPDGQIPNGDVIAFARAYEWNQETAATKLAPTLINTWFAATLLPKVKFRGHTKQEALGALADASGAGADHKGQLESVLGFLRLAGLVEVDGDAVRAPRLGGGEPDGNAAPAGPQAAPVAQAMPGTKALAVPDDFIVYRCKISEARVIEIALPPKFTNTDFKRLKAFLATQIDDLEPSDDDA